MITAESPANSTSDASCNSTSSSSAASPSSWRDTPSGDSTASVSTSAMCWNGSSAIRIAVAAPSGYGSPSRRRRYFVAGNFRKAPRYFA
ncbi:hypothetical protein G7043_04575 [Lentzea sp. NEAU-D13]|uniref:Uncharacterized protein n=1 Tax=Lentzea alba TaxID=2714351 RepID=A0A7C9RMJ2_9PSEU|nr:hypothetical protein [Lentzea alba]NGY58208.1 hypothetical protein [Lentzea alba]